LVLLAGEELVVGGDGVELARPVEAALGLVHVGRGDGGADVFDGEAVGGERGRVHLHAHGRLLAAADADEADAGELRDLLGEARVREVLDLGQGQGVRGQGQGEDGRVRGVRLAVDGRVGQVARQVGAGGVDGGLDLLFGHVDVQLEGELQGDDGAAVRAGGGHLVQAGKLPELP